MRYLVVSDLHLGPANENERSLLSVRVTDNRIDKLVKWVKSVVGSCAYILVVAGDGTELALARQAEVNSDFRAFCSALRRETNLIGVVFVIGNHEHHYCFDQDLLPESDIICHRPVLEIPTKEGELYFVHGDLMGSPGNLISTFLTDGSSRGKAFYDEVANLNAPLIEMLWWNLGQMGGGYGAGGLLEKLYFDLRKGKEGSVHQLIRQGLQRVIPGGIITGIPDKWEWDIGAKILTDLLQQAVGVANTRKAPQRFDESQGTRDSLEVFLKRGGLDLNQRNVVCYGHTHRSDLHSFGCTSCYNLGAWLVEPGNEQPDTMALFIDTHDGSGDDAPVEVKWEKIE